MIEMNNDVDIKLLYYILLSGFRRNAPKIQVYGDEFDFPETTVEVSASGHFQFFNAHSKIENEERFGRRY